MVSDSADLVAAAKAGDKAAFAELVKASAADLYTLAYRITGNTEDAQDVVQEAYMKAFKGLRRYRGDAKFTTWMYRITANCAKDLLAKKSKDRHAPIEESDEVVDERPGPEARMGSADDRRALNSALQSLPPDMRAVVVLRDIYDLPHEAIAAELGIAEGTAKVRLHRARKKLREQLFPLRGEESAEEESRRAV